MYYILHHPTAFSRDLLYKVLATGITKYEAIGMDAIKCYNSDGRDGDTSLYKFSWRGG